MIILPLLPAATSDRRSGAPGVTKSAVKVDYLAGHEAAQVLVRAGEIAGTRRR
ncbi:MAG TPA: hypothetical protein VKB76_20685 [Ktedonobacterales bacterium]|nr:hypothetical protein [Ktedonobacterales bacterium]